MDFTDFERDFIHIITLGKKNNTYKFALAKSILEFVEKNEIQIKENIQGQKDTEIKYSVFARDFLRYYWHQEKSKIPQNHNSDVLPSAVDIVQKIYEVEEQPEKFVMVKKTSKKKQLKI